MKSPRSISVSRAPDHGLSVGSAGLLRQRVVTRHSVLLGNGGYRWAWALAPWVLAAAAVLLFVGHENAFVLLITGTAVIYAMSAIGLTWLMGRAGLVSIGNGAIMAVGAYTTAILAPKAGWGAFPIPLVISGLFGAVVGLLIGIPALRLRGIYLALGTLALQYIVVFAGSQYESHTGDVSGIPVAALSIAGHEFTYGRGFVFILFGFLGLSILLVRNVLRHAPGRMWHSIRESELAASAVGVNVTRWKLSAFVGSSALIAVSGSLFAYYTEIVSSEGFSLDFAISFIVMIIIGGTGSIAGAIVGAVVVTILPHLLTTLTNELPSSGIGNWLHTNVFYLNNGLYGILVLLFLLYQPDGIVPGLRRLAAGILRRFAPLPQVGVEVADNPVGAPPADTPLVARPAVNGHRPAHPSVLSVENLTVTYRTGARAVDGVSLRVDENSIVALLGRNGAGKTSTLRAISGFMTSEQVRLKGRITIDGREVLGLPPVKASELAVLVAERDKIFPNLTVAEHLRIARPRGGESVENEEFFAGLRSRSHQSAGLLSGGERQLLALAMAWQLKPRLLLVDEFSLGLAPVMIRRVAEVIRQLREEHGMTFLIVEQNAAAALDLADWVYVLEGGKVVAEGLPSEIGKHDLLLPMSATTGP